MRDAFAVLFFVSSACCSIRAPCQAPLLIVATLAVVLIGKPLAAPRRGAPEVSVQGGAHRRRGTRSDREFSFILVAERRSRASSATAMDTPWLLPSAPTILFRMIGGGTVGVRAADGIVDARRRRGENERQPSAAPSAASDAYRAIVIGYGPTGRTLTRLLTENGIVPSVIELNMDTIRELREQGRTAIYGDASHPQTLESAGVRRAGSLFVTADVPNSEEVIRLARELNPRIAVLARTSHLRDAAALRRAGAQMVFSGEGEVALALIEDVLRRLGATPDQIDRERARVHGELSR